MLSGITRASELCQFAPITYQNNCIIWILLGSALPGTHSIQAVLHFGQIKKKNHHHSFGLNCTVQTYRYSRISDDMVLQDGSIPFSNQQYLGLFILPNPASS